VTHGLKAPRSTSIDLRKRLLITLRDTFATRRGMDIPGSLLLSDRCPEAAEEDGG
jgi:hypothetical protein